MRANEILSEISFGGRIPGLDEPILGQGSGAVVPGGAAMPAAATAAAKSAEATRIARQSQAAQAAQSQMVPSPASPKVTFGPRAFEPRTPAVWRRPEGRTAGGFDPTKPPYSGAAPRRPETELDKAMKVKPPPQYTQTPSDAARAADARKTLGARVAGATLGGTVAGAGGGAAVGIVAQKDQAARDMSTATPPPNDAWQAQPAPGQAAASKAAADELKKAPPRDRSQIDELGPVVIPALAGLGAAGLAGTVGYQMSKPSKPASGQPSSTAARPAASTTPAPAAKPAAADAPAAATTPRPAAATPRPSGGPRQGVVGSELAKFSGGQFATRADRTNQDKVDQVLGKGKFTAGTAEANKALRKYFKDAAIRQELERRQERINQQAADSLANITVRPAGSSSSSSSLTKPTELLPRVEIPASGGSSSGGPSSASPAASSSGDSSDNTVKSGTGLTWTDSSGNPVKFGVDETALQRLMTLSGQRH